jgi:uncharacterized protein (DUF488 family)
VAAFIREYRQTKSYTARADTIGNIHWMVALAKKKHLAAKTAAAADKSFRIFTIGHSIRPIEEFVDLLQAHGVRQVVDIRTIPRSRRNPQFNADALAKSLHRAHINYSSMKELGGLRHAKPDSINTAWRNASFRGFADYMQTQEFAEGIASLLKIGAKKRTAIMCAEAVPWRCHRSLVSDALAARGICVEHILSQTRAQPHTITPFARVRGVRITYPAQEQLPLPDVES